MAEFEGRRVLVTGATGGIGGAIARAFHERGAIVALHGTRAEKLQSLVDELGNKPPHFVADLANRDAISQLIAEVEEQLGGIDILVNNAGITKDGLFVRMRDADWDDVLAVNLSAVFALTRGFAAGMMKRRFGRIINISSVVGITGNPGQVNYCATKAGVVGFSKALAQELATRNITVNVIAPGFIASAMTEKLNDKQQAAILSSIPMNRMGSGSDIAAGALYLASDGASYVTGQTLHINGGLAMV